VPGVRAFIAIAIAAACQQGPPPKRAGIPTTTKPCAALPAAVRRAVARRLARWVCARTHGEAAKLDTERLTFGCVRPEGVLAELAVDLVAADRRIERSWVVRIHDPSAELAPREPAGAIEVLATADGPASIDQMEGVVQHSVTLLTEADVDGDGRRDVVIAETEHEIGSPRSDFTLLGWLSSKRRVVQLVTFTAESAEAGATPDGLGPLVLSVYDIDRGGTTVTTVRCVRPSGFVPCSGVSDR
jgi:hypothetical protein